MKIIYLHGLGSNGQSSTARGLSALGLDVVAPDYQPQCCSGSMKALADLVQNAQPDVVVGTSMGGYYALKLHEQFKLPTIAVNACFEPAKLLQKYLEAPAHDYVTDTPIPFDQAMLDDFSPLKATAGQHPPSLKVIVGLNDSVIAPTYQTEFCRQQGWHWLETDWEHRVGDVDLLGDVIKSVLA